MRRFIRTTTNVFIYKDTIPEILNEMTIPSWRLHRTMTILPKKKHMKRWHKYGRLLLIARTTCKLQKTPQLTSSSTIWTRNVELSSAVYYDHYYCHPIHEIRLLLFPFLLRAIRKYNICNVEGGGERREAKWKCSIVIRKYAFLLFPSPNDNTFRGKWSTINARTFANPK